MEMHERIRELRKIHLDMSQEVFGERLGVSRSVINNIERNCLARPDQKLSLIKLMCREFNVNEEWILNGTEPMIVQPSSFSLDGFVKERGMTDLEFDILKTYFELDPEIRKNLIEHFRGRLSVGPDTNSRENPFPYESEEELVRMCPPIEMENKEVG